MFLNSVPSFPSWAHLPAEAKTSGGDRSPGGRGPPAAPRLGCPECKPDPRHIPYSQPPCAGILSPSTRQNLLSSYLPNELIVTTLQRESGPACPREGHVLRGCVVCGRIYMCVPGKHRGSVLSAVLPLHALAGDERHFGSNIKCCL